MKNIVKWPVQPLRDTTRGLRFTGPEMFDLACETIEHEHGRRALIDFIEAELEILKCPTSIPSWR